MTEPRFDYSKLTATLERAARRRHEDAGFLHLEAATILGERLAVTEREFTNPVLLFEGMFADEIETAILACSPPIKGNFQRIEKPENDLLSLEPGSIDLAVSIFDLHRCNDLPAMLFQIIHALKPDGLFMCVLPSEGTLVELRDSLLKAEIEQSGGAGSRVDAFPHIRQLGDLLQKIGFKLPVADIEERTIRYRRFDSMINDLRNVGGSNISLEPISPLGRKSIAKAQKTYASEFSDKDGKLRATANLACLSGWKEDESQQKPLRPGSAKHQLKDFI